MLYYGYNGTLFTQGWPKQN